MATVIKLGQVDVKDVKERPKLSPLNESPDNLSTCSVCGFDFDEEKRIPKFLPCFHTFCLQCLMALSSSTVLLTCPLCHNTFTCNYGVENLQSNKYALHIAKIVKTNNNKHVPQPSSLEYWCFNCESVANLSCYLNGADQHKLITIGESTIKEAEDLQRLIKEISIKKMVAMQKRKQVQAHLNRVMQSLIHAEDSVKELIFKNDQYLLALMSLDEKVHLRNKKEMTVAALRDVAVNIALQLEESLVESNRIAEEYESLKRIRIMLHLRDSENRHIPTFSLFEDGFFSNLGPADNHSTTDRYLLVLSYLAFSILKRWNIPLPSKRQHHAYYSSGVLPMETGRPLPPPLPGAALVTNPPPAAYNQGASCAMVNSTDKSTQNSVASNTACCWAMEQSSLSYSQVLNMPKPAPARPLNKAPNCNGDLPRLPSFCFLFEERGNGKYNVPSKFLGEVIVQMNLTSHVAFVRELTNFCLQGREVTRKIAKASPGMFVTIQADNPFVVDAVPAKQSLGSWESPERTRDAWDVGINSALDTESKVVGWKWIFLLDKFKPNNMEVTMLFGKVLQGKDVLQRLSGRTKQDRFNLQISVKTVL